jgi:tRNA (guanine-N7-)-methyltransferase
MFANSRPVESRQAGPHPDLAKVVSRHLRTPYRKPIVEHNRIALQTALSLWRNNAPDAPLILDAGCGTGQSAIHLARRHPESFVLGVDQSCCRLRRSPARREALPANVALIRADLVDFWRLLAQEGIRLEAHYLLYPNPWPKPEHLKRRWHGHPVFATLPKLSGILECRGNWRIYVEELAIALGIATGLLPRVERWRPEESLSPFERKYQDSGHALWRLRLDLTRSPEDP